MFEVLLVSLVAASNVVAVLSARHAHRDRQRIVNACLSRTPSEFQMLEAETDQPRKTRKQKEQVASIPPIGL